MGTLFKILLIGHIIAGFIALIAGILPMVTKKGGKWHNLFGRIYFWAMFGVFLSSQPMALIKNNVFLFTVGVFSFYLVLTGYRFTKRKGYHLMNTFDRLVMGITFLTSLLMIGYAIYWMMRGNNQGWIVLGVFGLLCFIFSLNDLRKLGKNLKTNHWVIEHLNRMLGAYIATFTAFTVTNLTFLPGLIGWLVPALIGTIGITISSKYYRKKYGVEKRQ